MTLIELKNLLRGRVCEKCSQYKENKFGSGPLCVFWFGEAVGWQFREVPGIKTCDHWGATEEEHLNPKSS
jgi:hypothetical protein